MVVEDLGGDRVVGHQLVSVRVLERIGSPGVSPVFFLVLDLSEDSGRSDDLALLVDPLRSSELFDGALCLGPELKLLAGGSWGVLSFAVEGAAVLEVHQGGDSWPEHGGGRVVQRSLGLHLLVRAHHGQDFSSSSGDGRAHILRVGLEESVPSVGDACELGFSF